ncbi:MAG: DUF4079 family protein [Myxococcota bacterium]
MIWLAYLHPVAMIAILALGVAVLREGLRIRKARLAGAAVPSSRHRRLAKVLVPLAVLGFAAGPASLGWLRHKDVFESLHSFLAIGALSGLLAGGLLGLRLERREGQRLRALHSICAGIGLLIGLAAGVAGLAILP